MAKRFNFTYLFCSNLEKMKEFYSEILQLQLIWEDSNSIAYKIGNHQLSIAVDVNYTPLPAEFSKQPGWNGGILPQTSWSLECDTSDFLEIMQAIQKDPTVKTWTKEPKWVGYWSYPVLDPMNNTIEITCTNKEIY